MLLPKKLLGKDNHRKVYHVKLINYTSVNLNFRSNLVFALLVIKHKNEIVFIPPEGNEIGELSECWQYVKRQALSHIKLLKTLIDINIWRRMSFFQIHQNSDIWVFIHAHIPRCSLQHNLSFWKIRRNDLVIQQWRNSQIRAYLNNEMFSSHQSNFLEGFFNYAGSAHYVPIKVSTI